MPRILQPHAPRRPELEVQNLTPHHLVFDVNVFLDPYPKPSQILKLLQSPIKEPLQGTLKGTLIGTLHEPNMVFLHRSHLKTW